jgi:hypothetical protein
MAASAKTIVDPEFGSLKYCVDAWDGLVPFEYEPSHTTHFSVQLRAPVAGPTEAQQAAYRELKSRYDELWPSIAEALMECYGEATTVEELTALLNPIVGLYMIEDFDDPQQAEFELVYDLNRPNEAGKALFVRLHSWEIVEAVMAD